MPFLPPSPIVKALTLFCLHNSRSNQKLHKNLTEFWEEACWGTWNTRKHFGSDLYVNFYSKNARYSLFSVPVQRLLLACRSHCRGHSQLSMELPDDTIHLQAIHNGKRNYPVILLQTDYVACIENILRNKPTNFQICLTSIAVLSYNRPSWIIQHWTFAMCSRNSTELKISFSVTCGISHAVCDERRPPWLMDSSLRHQNYLFLCHTRASL